MWISETPVSWSVEPAEALQPIGDERRAPHAAMAASSGLMPTMFMMRVRLQASTHSAAATFGRRFIRKYVAPIRRSHQGTRATASTAPMILRDDDEALRCPSGPRNHTYAGLSHTPGHGRA